jgi:hypothetical protein
MAFSPLPHFVSTTLLLALLSSCSSDSDSSTPKRATVPQILTLVSADSATWSAQDSTLAVPCEPTAPLLLTVGPGETNDTLGDWQLMPPGGCDGNASCGYLLVTATPKEGGEAYEVISSRRQLDLPASVLGTGDTLTLKVELYDDFDQPVLVDDSPAVTTVEVTLSRPADCP